MNSHLSFVISIGFTCFIVLFLALGFTLENPSFYTVALAATPLLIIVTTIHLLDDQDVFSPLFLVLSLLVLGVFLKTIYLTFFDSELAQFISLDGRGIFILDKGLGGTILGILCFAIGYAFSLRNIPLKKALHYRKKQLRGQYAAAGYTAMYNSPLFLFFLTVVSILFSFCLVLIISKLSIMQGLAEGVISGKRYDPDSDTVVRGANTSLGYLRWGAVTLPQMVVLASLATRLVVKIKFRTPVFVLLCFLGIGSLLIPLFTSARLELLYFIMMIAMIYHYGRKHFQLRSLVIFVAVLFSVTGFLGELRLSGNVQSYRLSTTSAFERILGGAYFMDIGKTSVILDTVPDAVPYQFGKTFTLFLIAPIPRAIWPDKPAVRVSVFIGEEIYYRPDKAGIPPGFIGEAYLNFGFAGIAVFLWLLGVVSAKVYRNFLRKPFTPSSIIFYAISTMVLTLTLLSGDLTAAISQIFRFGLSSYIVFKILSLRRQRI